MPNGVPAGLLALAGSGQLGQVPLGRQPTFQSALTGSLGLLSQAQQGQGQRGDRQFDQMLQIAEMEQQIRQAEAAQAQAAQQREIQQTYIQSLPEGQRAQAAAFPKIFAGEQAKARFREPREPRAPAQVDTVRLPDGTVRSFRRDDPALDQALGQGGVRFNAQVSSPDIAGLGGATTATQTRAQQTLDTAQDTLGVIQQFRETLRPENMGLSGDIRGLGIGALGQAESFRAWGNDQTQQIIDQAIESGDTLDLSKFAVDPALSGQKLLENVLAYRLAKIQDPSGRISDKDFANAKLSLGTGKKLSSIGDVLARVDAFEQTVQRTQGIAQQRLGLQPQEGGPSAPAQPAPAADKRRQSLGVSQEDLEFTAQQNGMTVEQVLDQLEAR